MRRGSQLARWIGGVLVAAAAFAGAPASAALYDDVAAHWASVQRPEGVIPNVDGDLLGYGSLMMGAALAQRGYPAQAKAAALYWVAHEDPPFDPFNLLAASVIYQHADPVTRAWLGPAIARRLALDLPNRLVWYRGNWQWLTAAAAVRAETLGVPVSGTPTADVVAWARRNYVTLLARSKGYGGDRDTWPLAYVSFATAWLTQVTDRDADPVLRRAAVVSCRTIERTVSPSGVVAWYGRSNRESFAAAAAIVALRSCERYAPAEARHFEGAVQRIQAELVRSHPVLPDGRLAIVPRLALDPDTVETARGSDSYARSIDFNAFTLVLLGLARPPRAAPGSVRTGYVSLLGDRRPGVVSARIQSGWLGISTRRRSRYGLHPKDGRYGLGVQRAETRDGRSIVPAASITSAPDLALPSATSVVRTAGKVVLRGPGYALTITIRGCSVVEDLVVSSRRTVQVGSRVALDEAGTPLGSVRVSLPLRGVLRWRDYGADAFALQELMGRVTVTPARRLRIVRTGCL